MRHNESLLQQGCFKWFRLQYPEYRLNYFAVPNGGSRGKREAAIMKGEGVVAGVSDSILLVPSNGRNGLCIEFKKETITFDENGKEHKGKTYQSSAQKEWQVAVEKEGYQYVVIRNFDEFVRCIEDYLGRK